MREELRDVYGADNVRTISQVDYERCLLRKKQDAEYKEAVDNEDPPPPTLEELRALRVKYFTQQQKTKTYTFSILLEHHVILHPIWKPTW